MPIEGKDGWLPNELAQASRINPGICFFLVFMGPNNEQVGELSWADGILHFEGNADASAKIFFECVGPYFEQCLKEKNQRDSGAAMNCQGSEALSRQGGAM